MRYDTEHPSLIGLPWLSVWLTIFKLYAACVTLASRCARQHYDNSGLSWSLAWCTGLGTPIRPLTSSQSVSLGDVSDVMRWVTLQISGPRLWPSAVLGAVTVLPARYASLRPTWSDEREIRYPFGCPVCVPVALGWGMHQGHTDNEIKMALISDPRFQVLSQSDLRSNGWAWLSALCRTDLLWVGARPARCSALVPISDESGGCDSVQRKKRGNVEGNVNLRGRAELGGHEVSLYLRSPCRIAKYTESEALGSTSHCGICICHEMCLEARCLRMGRLSSGFICRNVGKEPTFCIVCDPSCHSSQHMLHCSPDEYYYEMVRRPGQARRRHPVAAPHDGGAGRGWCKSAYPQLATYFSVVLLCFSSP